MERLAPWRTSGSVNNEIDLCIERITLYNLLGDWKAKDLDIQSKIPPMEGGGRCWQGNIYHHG